MVLNPFSIFSFKVNFLLSSKLLFKNKISIGWRIQAIVKFHFKRVTQKIVDNRREVSP